LLGGGRLRRRWYAGGAVGLGGIWDLGPRNHVSKESIARTIGVRRLERRHTLRIELQDVEIAVRVCG